MSNVKVKRGFTLIEILVALAIISVLTSVAAVSVNNTLDRGRDTKRKQDLAHIKDALNLFFEENGKYPPQAIDGQPFTTTSETDTWIPEITPTYIKQLPKDPKQAALAFGAGPPSSGPTPTPVPTSGTFTIDSDLAGSVTSTPLNNNFGCGFAAGAGGGVAVSSVTTSRFVMRFPLTALSAIPAGSTVTKVQLQLNFKDQSEGYWDEGEFIFISIPPPDIAAGGFGPAPLFNGGSAWSDPAKDTFFPLPNNCQNKFNYAAGNNYKSKTSIGFGPTTLDLLTATNQDIINASKTASKIFSIAVNEDSTSPPAFGAKGMGVLPGQKLIISYGPPPPPEPGTGTPPASVPCTGKIGIYCLVVTPNRSAYTLWTHLENENDPQIYDKPDSPCFGETPPDSYYNYCLKPD